MRYLVIFKEVRPDPVDADVNGTVPVQRDTVPDISSWNKVIVPDMSSWIRDRGAWPG